MAVPVSWNWNCKVTVLSEALHNGEYNISERVFTDCGGAVVCCGLLLCCAVGSEVTSYELWVLSHNDMPNLTAHWQILGP